MGCSPSRGNSLHTTQGPFRRGRTLLPVTHKSPGESLSDDGGSEGSGGGDTDNSTAHNNISSTLTGRKFSKAEPDNVGGASAKLGTKEITINIFSQGKEKQEVKQEAFDKKSAKKSKKSVKGVKLNKKKEKERCFVEEKVDFPDPLVKAHQAAYGYLNPSITKYEDLLGLLDHAAQTQISLQPMVAFMILRYEEINKGLQEIVEEGEKMLKEHRDHLAWPNPKNISLSSPTFSEPPPDLLQQLLQYTVQRMQLVRQSVCGIGDTALEETVDYFSSISEVLEEKLMTKRTFESRLIQLLSRIEAASQRKPGPEDSTLFSEDSGIGAEIESLAGSERHCQRKGSCDSTETVCSPANFTPIHKGLYRDRLYKTISNFSSLYTEESTCIIKAEKQRDTESLHCSASMDEGDEGLGENMNDVEKSENKRKTASNSAAPDPRQPCRLPVKRIENPQNVEMTLKLKDAISSRILSCQGSGVKMKQTDSPKSSTHQWTEDGNKSSERPQTAATRTPKKKTTVTKQCRSRSADSLPSKTDDPTLTELERTQKELNQRLVKMNKVKCEGRPKRNSPKQIQEQQTQGITSVAAGRQHSLNKNIFSPSNQRKSGKAKVDFGEEMEKTKIKEKEKEKEKVKEKDKKGPHGPVKVMPVPSPPLSPCQSSGLYRSRNSVKKLIDTFSQGMEESKQMPENAKVLGPLKGVRKCGVPIIPGLGTSGNLAFTENNKISGQGESHISEMTEDLDINNLPPPPLEVLMDNSFENVQAKNTGENLASRGRSILPKRTAMNQRLRASLQSVTVLPSKGGDFRKSSLSMSPVRTVHQDTRKVEKGGHHDSSNETDTESEEAVTLYKQARKIIHLRQSSDSPTENVTADQGPRKPLPCQGEVEVPEQEKNSNDTVPNNDCGSQTPFTPPVSRTRVLPSTPLLHRRLPSPPVFKSQPTYASISSLSVVRKLPTPPSAGQRTQPNTYAMQPDHKPSFMSGVTYPFKAPSPPASPKVQRWSRENSGEDSSLRIFSNARSVFCPVSSSLFEAQPVPPPKAPQAWASTSRSPWGEHGRLPVSARGPQPFIRRSQSDRRPSMSQPANIPVNSVAETCGSEPAISTHGLEDSFRRENTSWNEQTKLRGTARSASHPDLCVVGQGLQRE